MTAQVQRLIYTRQGQHQLHTLLFQVAITLGSVNFRGSDGTNYLVGARIEAIVDATPGSNDLPSKLVFSTTADGASSPTERLRIRANGNTEPGADNTYTIGTSDSRWGSVWAANGTIQTSDERTKTQIANAHLGFEFIKSLRPVSYRWIEGGKRETGERNEDGTAIYESVPGERTHYGFIAQEVKEAVDAAGVDFGGWLLSDKDDPDSQQALRYDQFIAPLTKALQEAMTKIETLETANASQAATIAALDAPLLTLAGNRPFSTGCITLKVKQTWLLPCPPRNRPPRSPGLSPTLSVKPTTAMCSPRITPSTPTTAPTPVVLMAALVFSALTT
jgi:hypothetical protein